MKGAAACAAHDLRGCEAALLEARAADLPRLLAHYDQALVEQGDGAPAGSGWASLWSHLQAHPERIGLVHDGHHAGLLRGLSPDVWVLSAGGRPRSLSTERLLLALGQQAGRSMLVYVHGPAAAAELWQLFPHDPLGPFLLELPAILRAKPSRAQLQADIALAHSVRAALEAAGRFEYVAAAEQADRIGAQAARQPASAEPALRARFALSQLRAAGIALEPEHAAAAASSTAPPGSSTPAAPASSAMMDLVRVQLAGEAVHEEWSRRRARIVEGLSPDRIELLDYLYRPTSACPERQVPPMTRPADLLFANLLARALAPEGSPIAGKTGASGLVPLEQWLERYEAMVRMVASSGSMWALATGVLMQRGELHGLSAEGTATYKQVSELGMAHVTALRKLAKRFPERFRPMGVLPLVYLTGVMSDRRLRDAVIQLASSSVALKLQSAADPEGVYDAALAGLMAALSFPPAIQGPQLMSLRDAFAAKLSGPLGKQKGWAMAGLHGASGLFGLLTGQPGRLREVAPRAAEALTAVSDLPYPQLGKLAVSAARYGALVGTEDLDPTTANPALFTPARKSARRSLRDALAGLTSTGPATAPERELLADAAALGDGLIAVLGGLAAADEPAEPAQCRKGASLRDHPKLGNALNRLLRLRRRALGRTAFQQGDSPWLRRARLVVVVLSDALDVAARQQGVRFTLPTGDVEQILAAALRDWDQRTWAEAIRGGYALLRAALAEGPTDRSALSSNAAKVLGALAEAFAPEKPAPNRRSSLFDVLAKASQDADLTKDTDEIVELLTSYARKSYGTGASAQGDLFLFVALGVALAREEALPKAALDLADRHHRPVRLPLLLHAYRKSGVSHAADPRPLFAAMRQAASEHCEAPSPESLIRVRHALHDFRSGRRPQGLTELDSWLDASETAGLVVPRLVYIYEETTEETVFKVEGSISLASDFLLNSGSLQVGLGVRSAGKPGGEMRVRFADPTAGQSVDEAARLYAHVAALTAVYHFLEGNDDRAMLAARRAVPAWATGVRLGEELVPAGNKTAEWTQDAPGIIAVAAQQALEADQIFLAGDLWTLVRAALGAEADAEDVVALLDPPPAPLRELPKLEPVLTRARQSLAQVAAGLPCTGQPHGLETWLRADCGSYPTALALRIANALPALPHLKRGAEIGRPRCAPLRPLDTFLSAADQKRYDPDAFSEAVAALRKAGRVHDAATLLARQRHPQHCSPALHEHARALGALTTLGAHLRADLLSVAANCAGGKVDAKLVDDLIELDRLTQRFPIPLRNLELMLFAARLGLHGGEWEPLLRLSQQPNFVRRWLRFGPELATSALLVHHAAHVSAAAPLDPMATLPLYRLLCTTFPPAERGPACSAIGVLRSGAAKAEKKRAARDALTTLMGRLTVPREGQPAAGP